MKIHWAKVKLLKIDKEREEKYKVVYKIHLDVVNGMTTTYVNAVKVTSKNPFYLKGPRDKNRGA